MMRIKKGNTISSSILFDASSHGYVQFVLFDILSHGFVQFDVELVQLFATSSTGTAIVVMANSNI